MVEEVSAGDPLRQRLPQPASAPDHTRTISQNESGLPDGGRQLRLAAGLHDHLGIEGDHLKRRTLFADRLLADAQRLGQRAAVDRYAKQLQPR
jgi:hypothetical protein